MKHRTPFPTRSPARILVSAALFGVVTIGPLLAGEVDFSTSRTTPEKVALLVSVSDYPEAAGWSDLPGAKNDPELVKGLLVDMFQFEEEDIFVLRDVDATHENIVRGFHEWLIERSGPETQAVFWYSGHGSQVPDRSGVKGAEQDGKDSTLLAYDSRLDGREGSFDVSDDELASLLLALTQKTSWVTIVTDSCHSGGVVRGERDERIRSGPAGKTEHDFSLVEPFWPKGVEFYDDDAGVRADPSRYVHISACGPHQYAKEWYLDDSDDSAYGALTLFLSWRLRQVEPGQTYRQIVDTVGRWVSTRLDNQSVQREGAIDRAFLGSNFKARPLGFEAFASGRNQITLRAGRLHGLRRGSRVAISDIEGRALGEAEVAALRDVQCDAIWKVPPPEGAADIAMLANVTSHPEGRDPLALRVTHPELAARLGERDDIRLIQSERAVAHTLEVLPADATADSAATVVLRGPDGMRVWPGESGRKAREGWLDWVVESIQEPLQKEQKYQEIMALARLDGGLQLDSGFAPLDREDLDGMDKGDGKRRPWGAPMANADVRSFPGRSRGMESSNDFVAELDDRVDGHPLARLDVTNPTAHDVYVTVLSATEAREITVIWPPEGEDFLVVAGETRPVYTILGVHEGLDLDRPMRDRFLVVATREPANFHPLAQSTTLRSASPTGTGVPSVIENALAGRVTRGGSVRVDDEAGASFGITTVDVLVSERAPDGTLPDISGRLDDEVRLAFEQADGLELFALFPYASRKEEDGPGVERLHGYKILGRAMVDAPEAREVVSHVWRGIRDAPENPARCFEPRHALTLTRADGPPLTLVICYACSNIFVYVGDERSGSVPTSDRVKASVDGLFEAAGLQIHDS